MSRHTKETLAVDAIVGQRIKEKRIVNGMSRMQLADKIYVTHQQLQKYETGVNRISIGRLVAIAHALYEPLSYFVDGYDCIKVQDQHIRLQIEVSRAFAKIKDPKQQFAVKKLIDTMAGR